MSFPETSMVARYNNTEGMISMPYLNFLLTNPELFLAVEKDSESWSLRFDAKSVRSETCNSFKIFYEGKQYDGLGANGGVIIKLRMPQNQSQQSPPTKLNDKKVANAIFEEMPGDIRIDHFDPEWPKSNKPVPFFVVNIFLSTDTFFRLFHVNLERLIISLSLYTDAWEGCLDIGNDPDGEEIEWQVEKQNHAYAKTIHLLIRPRSDSN